MKRLKKSQNVSLMVVFCFLLGSTWAQGMMRARRVMAGGATSKAAAERAAQKARAALRPQYALGDAAMGFRQGCESLFADIVREAEKCQTNLAEYSTYPYWPNVMCVLSNFCNVSGCAFVDVGHHFGTWQRGCGKKVCVATSDMSKCCSFHPCGEKKGDGFVIVSRGLAYTNVACRGVGLIYRYDAEGRLEEVYPSVDKLPNIRECMDSELKRNYANQDQWMQAHGFADDGSNLDPEDRLGEARKNGIDRLNALKTLLARLPNCQEGDEFRDVCRVPDELRGPRNFSPQRPFYRPAVVPRPSGSSLEMHINTNDVIYARMRKRLESLAGEQDGIIERLVHELTGLDFGAPSSTNGVLDMKVNLGKFETCEFKRNSFTGAVCSVTLIAEFDGSNGQDAIRKELDLGLSVFARASGLGRLALTYEEDRRTKNRYSTNSDYKSVESLSQRFTVTRNRYSPGPNLPRKFSLTIYDNKNGAK